MKFLKTWNEAKKNIIRQGSVVIEILYPKLSEDRKDCFWYYDKTIASVTEGPHTFYVRAQGEIDIAFKEDSESYDNERAVRKAKQLNLKDIDLKQLAEDDLVQHNNWFLVEYYNEAKNNAIEISIDPTEYDYAIETAVNAFEDDDVMAQVAELCDCDYCKKRKNFKKFDL